MVNISLSQLISWTAVIMLVLGLTGCAVAATPTAAPAPTPTTPAPEPTIPPHFTTYTDEQRLFSISYPPGWETALSQMENLEDTIKGIVKTIESDLPIENASMVFLAGKPHAAGLDPKLNIIVESLDVSSLDEAAEAEIRGIKFVTKDYKLFTQANSIVGGREVVIVDHKYTIPSVPEIRVIQMIILQGKVVWITTCGTASERFFDVEKTCNQIVRSFQILR